MNKTVNEFLQYHLGQNQLGWVQALPCVCSDIINTVNKSMGFTIFQLCFGRKSKDHSPSGTHQVFCNHFWCWYVAHHSILEIYVLEVQNNLLKAKISESFQANMHHTLMFPFTMGSWIQFSTLHQCKEYKAKGEKRVAKFMPQYDGPYMIIDVDEEH